MPWGVQGKVVPWANRSVGVPCCRAPPRPPPRRAPPRPDPLVVCPGVGFERLEDWVELIAVQGEYSACAFCLNTEEIRDQVGRVEVCGGSLFGFRERLLFFGLLVVVGDRGKVRKL